MPSLALRWDRNDSLADALSVLSQPDVRVAYQHGANPLEVEMDDEAVEAARKAVEARRQWDVAH